MTATARGWIACAVPVALWLAHLTALSALVEVTCDRSGLIWLPHALTAGLALACVPLLVVAGRLTGGMPGDETEGAGSLRFLGWLGLGLGGASVLLILAEGLVVLGIDPCR